MTGNIDFGSGAIDPNGPIASLLITGTCSVLDESKNERTVEIVTVERIDEFMEPLLNPHYHVKFEIDGVTTWNAVGTMRQCCESAFSTINVSL